MGLKKHRKYHDWIVCRPRTRPMHNRSKPSACICWLFAGSGTNEPSIIRLYHKHNYISITCGSVLVATDSNAHFLTLLMGRKSICISEQGPQGPVSHPEVIVFVSIDDSISLGNTFPNRLMLRCLSPDYQSDLSPSKQ